MKYWILMLALVTTPAMAWKNTTTTTTTNNDTTNITNNYYDVSGLDDETQDLISGAIALSMIDCSTSTFKPQVGGGIAQVGGQESIALGGCKQWREAPGMFKFGITQAGGRTAWGAGWMVTIK